MKVVIAFAAAVIAYATFSVALEVPKKNIRTAREDHSSGAIEKELSPSMHFRSERNLSMRMLKKNMRTTRKDHNSGAIEKELSPSMRFSAEHNLRVRNLSMRYLAAKKSDTWGRSITDSH